MERPLNLRLKETMYLPNGIVVSAAARQRRNVSLTNTSRHESAHILAAGQIQWATIIPSGDYLGATVPSVMTATSAMAAHALGFDGTGHDRMLTKHYLGADPDAAASSAASVLAGKQEEMDAIAEALELKGTIGQPDVDEALAGVTERRRGIFATDVNVKTPDGESATFTTKSDNHIVMVPNEWVTLGKISEKDED